MKMFTFATAFANRSQSPTDPIYCEEGRMPVDNVVIHDTHIMKWLTPTQCLQYSSNICAAKIALGLGQERLYDGFRRFGFGESPGLPLPGQSMGVLRPRERPWVQVETASAAFGQGISVTSIQLVTAVSAIANRGRLFEPLLIKQVTDSAGAVLETPTAHVRRVAVAPAIARLMSEMLVSVTEGEGTGVEASIPGFGVAGKTATAQKIDPETGKYSEKYIASFVGFVPADKPRLAVVVVIDEPMAGTYAGGSVAAPVFRRVGEMALRYLGVTPSNTELAKLADVSAIAKETDPATLVVQASNPGGSTEPAKPTPPPARKPKLNEALVPDLTGYPMREAIRQLVEKGLVPEVDGTGLVLHQDPLPNHIVPAGAHVQLSLEPPT
jgi:cell division protein FtsI (penicillin-binding protein 3)